MRSLLIGIAIAAMSVAGAARADVAPGIDVFETAAVVSQYFSGPYTIPAEFFGYGSEEFGEELRFAGAPLGGHFSCPGTPLLTTSLIVRRLESAVLPGPGSCATVPVELVSLSLRSITPIVITYGGYDYEEWDTSLLLGADRFVSGSCRICATDASGGTFDLTLRVRPTFEFFSRSYGGYRYFDPLVGDPGYAETWSVTGAPWSAAGPTSLLDTPCDSEFRPGVVGDSNAGFTLSGPYNSIPVRWTPSGATAARGASWGALKIRYR